MAAPKGNKYWQLADPDTIGRPPNFPTPKDLLEKAYEYFEWIDENPIVTKKITHTDKGTYVNSEDLQKPYTWTGLYVYLGVTDLKRYREKKEFVQVLTHIDNVIKTQKFEGATSGVFNHNIIARDLGLKDKSETDVTSKGDKINITPIVYDRPNKDKP